jgi:hypothetical protein
MGNGCLLVSASRLRNWKRSSRISPRGMQSCAVFLVGGPFQCNTHRHEVWKSKPVGGPALPKNLQELIRRMAAENPTWGEEHIANELKLKLGIRISPRTVRKYRQTIAVGHRIRRADLRPQSCPGHCRLRLFCGFHSRFRILICIRDHGTGQAPSPPVGSRRHRLPAGQILRSKAVLGGLHHECWLEKVAE